MLPLPWCLMCPVLKDCLAYADYWCKCVNTPVPSPGNSVLAQMDTERNAGENTKIRKHSLTKSCSSYSGAPLSCLYGSLGTTAAVHICDRSLAQQSNNHEKRVWSESRWKLFKAGAPGFPEQIDLHMSWHGVCCLITYWSCHTGWKSQFLHMGEINTCWFHDNHQTIWAQPFLVL